MTPSVPPPVLDFLHGGDPAASRSVGVIVLGVLLVALVARVLLESAMVFPRRETVRLLDLVAAPLLVVFVLVVLERFRDLS
ncbi:MAG TPA: hypothetical protein VK659_28950 [Asanoa sp.]|nr:hypothetical protein [Asanoa sp.]